MQQSHTGADRFSTNTSTNSSSVTGLSCIVFVESDTVDDPSANLYVYKAENDDLSSPSWTRTITLYGVTTIHDGLGYVGYDTLGVHKYLMFADVFTENQAKDIVYLTKPSGR